MNLVENIMAFFQKPKVETQDKAPEDVCANCWGVQEYDHMIRDMYKDKQIDVNNHEEHYAFIQDFVVNHIEGIHLIKEDDKLTCPNCHIHYVEETA